MKRGLRAGVTAGVLLAGCFYIDPLNSPPIVRSGCTFLDSDRSCSEGAMVRPGERIRVRMTVDDPDENADLRTHRWEAFTCADSAGTGGCDRTDGGTFYYGLTTFKVPASMGDVRSIALYFHASDELGATGSDAIVLVVDGSPVSGVLEPGAIQHLAEGSEPQTRGRQVEALQHRDRDRRHPDLRLRRLRWCAGISTTLSQAGDPAVRDHHVRKQHGRNLR